MKGINPVFFGPSTWRSFEEIPWLFPNEILSLRDQITVIRFFDHLFRLLPCMKCRSDATELFQQIGIAGMLSTNSEGYQFMTRIAIAKWIYSFHNTVNRKLGKPTFGEDWLDTISNPREFIPSLSICLLSISYSISKSDEDKESQIIFKSLMYIVLPRLLRWKPQLSNVLVEHLTTIRLDHDYSKWFEWTFILINKWLPTDFPSFSYTVLFLEAYSAKGDCTIPTLQEKGTIFQGLIIH